jgi:hypothetical protein
LQSETKPVVVASPRPQHRVIGVIEMEIATQLGGRGIAGVAAVAPLWLRGQEIDGHSGSFLGRLVVEGTLRDCC